MSNLYRQDRRYGSQEFVRQLDRYQSEDEDDYLESNYSNDFNKLLCPFARKGICRYTDDECSYFHKSCLYYDSCRRRGCLFAHSLSWSNNITSRSCRNGIDCFTFDCQYQHPRGWNPCTYGTRCTNRQCQGNHPDDPPRRSRYGHECKVNNQFTVSTTPADIIQVIPADNNISSLLLENHLQIVPLQGPSLSMTNEKISEEPLQPKLNEGNVKKLCKVFEALTMNTMEDYKRNNSKCKT